MPDDSTPGDATPDDATPDDAIGGSVLAEQPDALMRFLELYGTLWSHGELPQSVKEVARLRNARTTDCAYCRNVRFAGARDEGLTEDRVASITDGFEDATDLDAREKAAIRFTDTFLREPGALGDEQRADLLEQFTPSELVELATGVALFMGFSKIAVALGPPPEMDTLVVPTPDWPPQP